MQSDIRLSTAYAIAVTVKLKSLFTPSSLEDDAAQSWRSALFETGSGETVFEYDKPSTLFGQLGDEQVTEIRCYLDRKLEAARLKAAG